MRRKTILGGKDPGFEFSRMALYLIAVGIDAAEEVCTAVDVQHDAVTFARGLLAPIEVPPHLDPLALELAGRTAPLPPLLPADARNAIRPELCGDGSRSGCKVCVWDGDGV